MSQFTYQAWVVYDARHYLDEYRRDNVCTRTNEKTRSELLKEVPKFMTNRAEDRYAYALLVIESKETSESEKKKQVAVIEELMRKRYLPACNSYGCFAEDGKYYAKREDIARQWYEYCHKNGYAIGTYNYARCLLRGIGGPTDFNLGRKLMEEAANKGFAPAMSFVADGYAFGQDSYPQYYVSAYEWYTKAAKQLFPHAAYNLGILLLDGKGCNENHAEAAYWFEKSAAFDNVTGMLNIGIMYMNGDGVTKHPYKGHHYLLQAASLGHPKAMYCVGLNLKYGNGCDQNLIEARSWFNKAASLGHQKAKEALSNF